MIRLPSTCFARRGVASPLAAPLASQGDEGNIGSPTSQAPTGEDTSQSRFSTKSGEGSIHRSRFFLQHETSAVLADVYELEKTPLGKGGFGTVWRARLKGQGGPWTRAVKTTKKINTEEAHPVKHEAIIMKGLDHPHVCRIFETFEEPGHFHMVLELVDGQDLFDYVFGFACKGQVLEEHVAANLTWQILQGLHYCHCQEILHRDVKPENIVIQNAPEHIKPHIKIIDFGLATAMTPSTGAPRGRFEGTFTYAAPEVKKGQSHSAASDLWSVGLIVHALLLGGLPGSKVCDGRAKLQISGNTGYETISVRAQEFLVGMLQIEPRRRLVAARVEMSNENSWTNFLCKTCTSETRMSASTLEAFVGFHQSTMIHKAVITATALQLLETAGIQEIKDQFVAMDMDGNGTLSQVELSYAMSSRAPKGVAGDVASWIEFVFASIDTDCSGEIEYAEFLAAAFTEGRCLSDQAIEAAFRVFDFDRSGKVSAEEFARVLENMPEEIVKFMKEFDADGDGEINFDEFKNILHMGAPFPPMLVQCSSSDSSASCKGGSKGRRAFLI